MAPSPLRVVPLPAELRKSSQLGAEVVLPSGMHHLSLDKLTEQEKTTLKDGLYQHGILVVRDQHGIHPGVMPQIGKFFDETAGEIHSAGEKMVTDKRNILSQNRGARNPRATQVGIIGKGRFDNVEGCLNLDLKHVDHTEFHEHPLSPEEIAQGYTRPYRWHMDMPLNGNLPGFVTSLHCLQAPELPDQKIKFPDQDLAIPAGATAFLSGARAFELLTPEEKEFALNTTVLYAPRAYEWMRDCKATEDGFTIAKTGREKPLAELHDNLTYPMVWKNAGTGQPHLQILGCNVLSLRTTNPQTGEVTETTDLDEVRKTCRRLLSRVYAPENIYPHRWAAGDLVVFHNRGVLHSITGSLLGPTDGEDPERRLLWQCNMVSGTPPVPFAVPSV
ncbi:alpha-ketoglutarate dependent xanthine dioxygenase [Phyllosticta capitalensis]|uniref:Alpha-ketoglutarate dependent xanthine dioxygenase n=1 Tax=Phyllosticta capitalensis TaxID=121624 RepID=A0ABR1YRC3_9PEZI